MRDQSRRNIFIFTAAVSLFVVLVGVGMLLTLGIGSRQTAYESGEEADYSIISKGKLRKVTIKRQDDAGCIEVSADGTVRVFAACGGEVTDGYRVSDTRFINRLFQILSDGDLSKLPTSGRGPYIELVIETDIGTQTIRVYTGGGGGDQNLVNDIIKVINDIITQLPTPTPSPGATVSPTPFSYTPTPNPTLPSWVTATPTTFAAQQPFVCDFVDSSGKKRPYNISNILCSTEPTPVQ